MNFITTTDLRTKSSELVNALKRGGTISLIHRSKVVGVIKPISDEPREFNAERFQQLAKTLNLPPTTDSERKKNYKMVISKKYGKDIS